MADKIKKGDWSAQTTAILLIVAPILVMLFNSLGPVNATAGLLNFTFTPDSVEHSIFKRNDIRDGKTPHPISLI